MKWLIINIQMDFLVLLFLLLLYYIYNIYNIIYIIIYNIFLIYIICKNIYVNKEKKQYLLCHSISKITY